AILLRASQRCRVRECIHSAFNLERIGSLGRLPQMHTQPYIPTLARENSREPFDVVATETPRSFAPVPTHARARCIYMVSMHSMCDSATDTSSLAGDRPGLLLGKESK